MKTNSLQNITHLLNKTPEKIGLTVATVAAVIGLGGSVALAWGPDRPTYTLDAPADHVTFNSITNNPAYGDERGFLRLKEASAANSTYSDETKIEPGKTYRAYVYYHNNASSTLNDAAHQFKGIANNAKMRISMPSGLNAGERTGMTGFITADNAQPQQVHDDTFMTATNDVALRYVPGSAKINSFGPVNGQTLPDAIFTTGALLGYDSLNGKLPGCNEFAGYVTFDFKADAPNFTLTKQVSKKGASSWQKNITAAPGEEIDYLISYKNTGSTVQNNVLIKDQLPQGVAYVGSSSNLANTANPKGVKTDDGVTVNGINVGNYAPNGAAYVKFTAKISDKLNCGKNDLVNSASAITGNGKKSDTATVTVDVKCAPNECKPGIPTGDARCGCVPKQGEVVDAKGNCVAASLPTTGPAEVIMSLIAVAAITFGVVYYLRSRRDLQHMLESVQGEQGATTLKKHDATPAHKPTNQEHVTNTAPKK